MLPSEREYQLLVSIVALFRGQLQTGEYGGEELPQIFRDIPSPTLEEVVDLEKMVRGIVLPYDILQINRPHGGWIDYGTIKTEDDAITARERVFKNPNIFRIVGGISRPLAEQGQVVNHL